MKRFAVLSVDGETVASVASAAALPPGAVEVPPGVDLAQLLRAHLVGGVFEPRPSVPLPAPVVGGIQIPQCPPVAVLRALDCELGEVLFDGPAPADPEGTMIALPDPGRYQFELIPPPPWLGWVFNHEVPQ